MKAIDLKYSLPYFKHEFKPDGKHVLRIGYNHKTQGMQSFEHHLNIDSTENLIVYNGPDDRNWIVTDLVSRKLRYQLMKGQAINTEAQLHWLEYCIRTGRFTHIMERDQDIKTVITALLERFQIPYKIINVGNAIQRIIHFDLLCPRCTGRGSYFDKVMNSPISQNNPDYSQLVICPMCNGTRMDQTKALLEIGGWLSYDPTKVIIK